ncbi:hypothetical protein pdam_00009287 [Pocillopora damicornis]|uniref:Uncharacterized protein n=1 Tax=Pocillopora damicornis TaxID=46731 RepID=A0A3M6TTW8_POCDA|nr:hypothetical protein pdam_00009287 [Pocillopora damicornis]
MLRLTCGAIRDAGQFVEETYYHIDKSLNLTVAISYKKRHGKVGLLVSKKTLNSNVNILIMITIVIHGQASFTTLVRMLRDWFKFMLSIPRHEPMSKTEKFVQWSSLLVYCLGGLTFLAVPKLYGIILNVEYTGRSEGYVRLVGLGVVEIGFLFIILARSTVRIHRYGTILASVVSRLVWVPATGLMFILRNMVPFTFALVFMGLDVLLSLSTLFIWCRERDGSSLGDFLKELLAPFRECHGMKVGGTITAVFFVGLIQTIFWYVLAVRPNFAHKMFVLDDLDGLTNRKKSLSYDYELQHVHLHHLFGVSVT